VLDGTLLAQVAKVVAFSATREDGGPTLELTLQLPAQAVSASP
jgi:hypothetical protein